MEPYTPSSSRAEAERWLLIAEKLLAGRDLIGSKTFAIRARESEPRLDAADLILAVVDTLIAGEKRINGQPDWYAILQLGPQTRDMELIVTHYRRLAILLDPHRNRLTFADQAFKLVSDAWSVLSNPSKKSLYDNELNLFSKQPDPDYYKNQHYQQQQQHVVDAVRPSRGLEEHHEPPHHHQQHQQHAARASRGLEEHLEPHQQQQQQHVVAARPSRGLEEHREQPHHHQQQQQHAARPSRGLEEHHDQPHHQQQQQHAARPSRGLEEHHEQPHHHYKNQQQKQQPQHAVRPSPRNNNANNEGNVSEESELHNKEDENSTFWTACPYCYNMYEYPRVYEECTLRCQNCRRAFHSVKIPAPPVVEGKEVYLSCWGFYPLGVPMSKLDKNKGGVSIWTPFSPMIPCPRFADGRNVAEENVNGGGQRKNGNARKSSVPRIYIDDDDDDVYVEISDSSDESDDEWGSTRKKKKKAKNMKGKGSAGKNVKKQQGEKAKKLKGASGDDDLQGRSVMQEGKRAPSMSNAESSRKAAINNAKKQTGKVPKEWGKLDLNVEFSNEVEEPAPGMREGNRAGNGEEDGIEGIGFFEGLDEFLSSLPILNVVGDDKVKAA